MLCATLRGNEPWLDKDVNEVAQDYVKGLLSGGEVVLVDTRQHWMAAVRYALKPIVLFGAVLLLALINSWLQFDGALSFINDVLRLILVVMVVVALVWLPINLVQWYSRKYVLTNRRAMRMSGVVRKTSFDSSLEQINDIAFEQSFLGRSLGYANLTLYTASDTANEQYEQLMDGLQFKKAVLDAKEAIRHGQPLTALADGFIVKGGTNEASMRADGRIEEAAAQSAAPSPDDMEADVADDVAGSAASAAASAAETSADVDEPSVAAESSAAEDADTKSA